MQFENQFAKPWYAYTDDVAPKNATPAKYVIGEGANTLTITYGTDIEGNGSTIVIAVATGNSKPLAATYVNKVLTITLATDGAGAADDTKNTYALVAAAIKAIPGFNAVAAGTGAISAAAESDDFTDGHQGTVCVVPGTFIKKSDSEWYVNIAPNGVHDANWRKLTVATY